MNRCKDCARSFTCRAFVLLLLVAQGFYLSSTSIASVSASGWFTLDEPKHDKAQACMEVDPGLDATVFWPKTWWAGEPQRMPTAKGAAVSAYWRIEICRGIRDHELAFDWALPGVRRLVTERAGDFLIPGATGETGCDESCAGVIRVTRLQGCPTLAHPLASTDADEQADALALGPDSIEMFLEGAEFFLLSGLHTGNCSYEFPFAVTLPGRYRLIATAVRTDWAGLAEAPLGSPPLTGVAPLTLDDILGSRAFIQLGRDNAHGADRLRETVLHGRWPHNASSQSDALPTCSVQLVPGAVPTPPPGRWVQLSSVSGMFDAAFHPALNFTSMVKEYTRYGLDVRDLMVHSPRMYTDRTNGLAWRPYACRMPRNTANISAIQLCLSRQPPFTFRGDSQTRTFFNAIMKRFAGEVQVAVKHTTSQADIQGIVSGNQCAKSMDACFAWDQLLSTPFQDFSTRSLVLNAGQWHLWVRKNTIAAYSSNVLGRVFNESSGWLALASTRVRNGGHLVWLETTQSPLLIAPYLIRRHEARSTQRTVLINRAAQRFFASRGWTRVPADGSRPLLTFVQQNDILGGLTGEYIDGSHPLVQENAMNALADRLLLTVCGSDS